MRKDPVCITPATNGILWPWPEFHLARLTLGNWGAPLVASAQSLLQPCLALGPLSKLGTEAEGGSELPALPVHHTSEEGATREPGSVCCLEKAGGALEVLRSLANFFSLTKG